MSRNQRKTFNLSQREELRELMKQLYGVDDVKEDKAPIHTSGTPRTKVAGQVVESSSTA